MRIRIVLSDGHHLLREQVIERVNGLAVARQELRHLDVVEFGDHKMHVFDDSLLPEGELALETTVHGAPVLGETQPGTMRTPLLCGYGLKPMGEAGAEAIPLAHLSTLVGPPGQSALIVRRREKMYLTRLSRVSLRVNGRDADAGSQAVAPGDTIEVGPARYELVAL